MTLPNRVISAMQLCCLLFHFAQAAQSTTLVVPDDHPTIQTAIFAASSGDSVLVRAGTYFENVNFLSKGIVLKSLAGPASTIIDGSAGGISVVYMRDVPDVGRLEGFTLRGGGGIPTSARRIGGGVCIRDSLNLQMGLGPLIRDNWITGNAAQDGGGVYMGGVCRVVNNRIYLNEAESGGGVRRSETSPSNNNPRVISDNEIFSNRAVGQDVAGGGAAIPASTGTMPVLFVRNVVACNDADLGGGVLAVSSAGGMVVEGNTVVANTAAPMQAGGLLLFSARNLPSLALRVTGNVIAYNVNGGVRCWLEDQGAVPPLMECNDFFGNIPDFVDGACGQVIGVGGNFSADPLFGQITGCPPADGDFCLSDDSPLLPENSPPGCGLIGALGACLPIGVPGIEPAPRILAVHAARPNPFSDQATIPFELPSDGAVLVTIYNARGEVVLVQPPKHQPAGQGSVSWDGRDRDGNRCPPGVYFARIKSGGQEFATRLVLVY